MEKKVKEKKIKIKSYHVIYAALAVLSSVALWFITFALY